MKNKTKKSICFALMVSFASFSLLAISACGDKDGSPSVEESNGQRKSDYALLLDTYTIDDYNSNVKVFDANNKQITVEADGTFIVRTPGRYTIDFGEDETYLYAYAKMPKTDYVYSSNIEGKEFVAGDTLVLPDCDIQNEATDYDEYNVIIWKNNEIVQTFDNGASNSYFLETSGDYKAVYTFKNVFGVTESDVLEFTAIDRKRIVYAKEVEEELILGSEVTYNTYGYYLSQKYASALTVKTPSGMVYSDNKVTFNEYGEYTLTFSSNVNGTAIEEECKVNTILNKTSIFSNKNNINYVRESELDEFCLDGSGSPEFVGVDALQISSANSSGQVYYSSIIDLSQKTKNEKLIEFYVDKTNGELQDICITLIDVYNPQITVRFNWMQNPWNESMSYGKVSANNQIFFWKNGDTYDTYYGTVLGCGYTAGVASGAFSCGFDWETQSAYMGNKLVADFKNEATVPPNFAWNGFTTGEVYLRVDFSKCTNGGIFVKSVDGKEISTVNPALMKDENTICLDREYEILPDGAKGIAYPLPKVLVNKAVELYDVNTSLFCGSIDKSSLLNGNAFVPDVAGLYTVRYQAVDSFGKLVTKSYDVQINETARPITISGDFSNQRVDIMSRYQVPVFTSEGGHGKLNETVAVTLNGEQLFNDGKGYFITEKGTLNVSIQVSDYLGNIEKKEYTVSVNDDVQLFHFNSLPKQVFAGDTLDFDVSAINYKTGGEMDVSVYVNDVKITGNYTVPGDTTSLRVFFIAKDGTKTKVSEVYTVQVNPNALTSIKDYAQTDATLEKIVLSSGVVYKLNANGSGYNFNLPYYLSAYEFAFKFGFNDAKINASAITLTLQDVQNPEQAVNVYFSAFNSDVMTVKINSDIVNYSLKWSKSKYQANCGNLVNAGSYVGKSFRLGEIIFDVYTGVFLNSAGEGVATIKKYANGEKFEGFSSGAIICSFSVTGVSAETEFILASVCNQSFGYRVHGDGIYDNAEAVIALSKPLEKSVEYGGIYTIPAIAAYDVLSPGGIVKLQIKTPSGDKLVDEYSLVNGYSFTANEYGVYRLIFTSEDVNGISRSIPVNVSVEYPEPPQGTINGTVNKTYKVGDTLQIPTCTITENPDAGNISLFVLMRTPDGMLYEVSGTYTFIKAGNYQLVYRLTDEYENVTRIVYNITVE